MPVEPGQIAFGLALYGTGQIWVREVQLLAIKENGTTGEKFRSACSKKLLCKERTCERL